MVLEHELSHTLVRQRSKSNEKSRNAKNVNLLSTNKKLLNKNAYIFLLIFLSYLQLFIFDLLATDKSRYFAQLRSILVNYYN